MQELSHEGSLKVHIKQMIEVRTADHQFQYDSEVLLAINST